MKKSVVIIFSVSLLLLFSLSFVSAGFWDWLQGPQLNPPSDGTPFSNADACTDRDNGVYSANAGAITKISGTKVSVWKLDRCMGNGVVYEPDGTTRIPGATNKLREYYCESGKLRWHDFTVAGKYCAKQEITIGEKTYNSAKLVSKVASCTQLNDNSVIDQDRNVFKNGCYNAEGQWTSGGDNGLSTTHMVYKTFSCVNGVPEEDTTQTQNCETLGAVYCKSTGEGAGCVGICQDTDIPNNKDVGGKITVNNIDSKDTCVGTDKVRQYSCSAAGTARDEGVTSCGTNRECVLDSDGEGYCRDKFVVVATIEGLQSAINILEARVTALETAA